MISRDPFHFECFYDSVICLLELNNNEGFDKISSTSEDREMSETSNIKIIHVSSFWGGGGATNNFV